MVWFHTFWVQTELHFSHLKIVLLPHWHRQYFDSPFTTTWFKVSSFILVPAIPEVLGDFTVWFLPYFPRVSITSSRKNFNNGILFPWILHNNLQAVTAVAFIIQAKKGHHHFLERICTRQVETNWSNNKSTPPIFALYSLKELGIGMSTCFFSAFDQRFVDEIGFGNNSWWQRWQLRCFYKQEANCFHQMYNQSFPGFLLKCSFFL